MAPKLVVLLEAKRRLAGDVNREVLLGNNTCDVKHGKICDDYDGFLISFSTINYSDALPLAQGIKF